MKVGTTPYSGLLTIERQARKLRKLLDVQATALARIDGGPILDGASEYLDELVDIMDGKLLPGVARARRGEELWRAQGRPARESKKGKEKEK